jgi:23S rRNA pseudouridine1911/1915/1917 synthase
MAPRRFPAARSRSAAEWRLLIVGEEPDYVVVNKPRGVPMHASVDNAHENLVQCMAGSLGVPRLWAPHRLDIDTSGLVLLSKTAHFAARFQEGLREGRASVRKLYRATVHCEHSSPIHKLLDSSEATPVEHDVDHHMPFTSQSQGQSLCQSHGQSHRQSHGQSHGQSHAVELVHWQLSDKRAPKTFVHSVSAEEIEMGSTWRDCRLRILCESRASDDSHRWDLTIELLTGRTHQIRGQLQLVGLPIVGDKMYTNSNDNSAQCATMSESPRLCLQACHLAFAHPSEGTWRRYSI